MNAGAKVTLGIGAVITVLSLLMMIAGGAQIGSSVGDVDISTDEVVYQGTEGGSFISEGALYSFSVYAVGSNETVDCDVVSEDIGITNSSSGEDLFIPDCQSDEMDSDDRTFLGWVINGADTFIVNATGAEIIVTQSGVSGGDIGGFFSGAFTALIASGGVCCGILFLIIGGIIAITAKPSQPSHTMQIPGSDQNQLPPSN